MTNRLQILTAAATITLLIFGGPAAASDNDKLAYDSEATTNFLFAAIDRKNSI
jgi:hypothetical protein